jgi:DNA-binding MarR family transcriptional regulator
MSGDRTPSRAAADVIVDPADLADVVARLRRAMRRAARRAAPELELSVAQLELMNVVDSMPSARSGELAVSLRIAPNSVSTLTNELVRLGMLERRRGTADRRTVELMLTPRGRDLLGQWHATNESLVSRALESIPADDQLWIQRALSSLQRLAEQVDAQADEP